MAKARELEVGATVHIIGGEYEGHTATVTDNVPIPDGGDHRAGVEHQRKVQVDVHDAGQEPGQSYRQYILPRLLTVDTPMVKSGDITDPMDPVLDRFRPAPELAEKYIRRTLPNGMTDVDYLLSLRENRDANGYAPNVALIGQSQSGKSMLAQVMAIVTAERDGHPKPYPVFTLNGSTGVTNYDIFGQTTAVLVKGKEQLVWMKGIVEIAATVGGILNLEEWNAVPPAQQVALHPLLDNTRRFLNTQKAVEDGHGNWIPEEVKVTPNLWVLCTINPGTYKGTHALSEATSNRFRWLPWDYDDAVEETLIHSKTVRGIGTNLRMLYDEKIITVPVGTSALMRLNADCADYGVKMAMWSFTAMFPPMERELILQALNDGGFIDTLEAEYPDDTANLGGNWPS